MRIRSSVQTQHLLRVRVLVLLRALCTTECSNKVLCEMSGYLSRYKPSVQSRAQTELSLRVFLQIPSTTKRHWALFACLFTCLAMSSVYDKMPDKQNTLCLSAHLSGHRFCVRQNALQTGHFLRAEVPLSLPARCATERPTNEAVLECLGICISKRKVYV